MRSSMRSLISMTPSAPRVGTSCAQPHITDPKCQLLNDADPTPPLFPSGPSPLLPLPSCPAPSPCVLFLSCLLCPNCGHYQLTAWLRVVAFSHVYVKSVYALESYLRNISRWSLLALSHSSLFCVVIQCHNASPGLACACAYACRRACLCVMCACVLGNHPLYGWGRSGFVCICF